jgi:hypothetical protein
MTIRTGAARDPAAEIAGTVSDKAGATAASVRASLRDSDLPTKARMPVPIAVLDVAVVLVGVLVHVARRRRP